jgi:hypothetical protein
VKTKVSDLPENFRLLTKLMIAAFSIYLAIIEEFINFIHFCACHTRPVATVHIARHSLQQPEAV